jgi:hypothetical protein
MITLGASILSYFFYVDVNSMNSKQDPSHHDHNLSFSMRVCSVLLQFILPHLPCLHGNLPSGCNSYIQIHASSLSPNSLKIVMPTIISSQAVNLYRFTCCSSQSKCSYNVSHEKDFHYVLWNRVLINHFTFFVCR